MFNNTNDFSALNDLVKRDDQDSIEQIKVILNKEIARHAYKEKISAITTAAVTAIEAGKIEILQMFLDAGLSANACVCMYVCPRHLKLPLIHFAAKFGQLEIVKLLVAKEAKLSQPKSNIYLAQQTNMLTGVTPEHLGLGAAIEREHTEIVDYLLQQGAAADVSYGWERTTFLAEAAKRGNLHMVESLLKYGANIETHLTAQSYYPPTDECIGRKALVISICCQTLLHSKIVSYLSNPAKNLFVRLNQTLNKERMQSYQETELSSLVKEFSTPSLTANDKKNTPLNDFLPTIIQALKKFEQESQNADDTAQRIAVIAATFFQTPWASLYLDTHYRSDHTLSDLFTQPLIEFINRVLGVTDNTKKIAADDTQKNKTEKFIQDYIHYNLTGLGTIEQISKPAHETFEQLLVALQEFDTRKRTELMNKNSDYRKIRILMDLAVGRDFFSLEFLQGIDLTEINFMGISVKGKPVTTETLRNISGARNSDYALLTEDDLNRLSDSSRKESIRQRLANAFAVNGKIIRKDGIINLVPFSAAAMAGDFETVKARMTATQVSQDDIFDTTIMLITGKRYPEIVSFLIEKVDNINQKNEHGDTLLHAAAITWNFRAVKKILHRGAAINEKNHNQQTALDNAVSLSLLGRWGTDLIDLLIEKNATIDLNMLKAAIECNNYILLTTLLPTFKERTDVIPHRPWYVDLMFSSVTNNHGNLDFLTLLKNHGANFNQMKNGETLLNHAIKTLKSANSDTEKGNFTNPRHSSFIHGIVTYLVFPGIRKSKNEVPAKNIVDMLAFLRENGVDIQQADKKGVTPVHMAVSTSNIEALIYLIAQQVNLDVKDSAGNTPLQLSVQHINFEATDKLLKAGADTTVLTNENMNLMEMLTNSFEKQKSILESKLEPLNIPPCSRAIASFWEPLTQINEKEKADIAKKISEITDKYNSMKTVLETALVCKF